ncbi:MICOS complex subunit MIC60 [Bacteroides uniformis]|nr:MICOS complex subunit MIC60 [Bacteroides uniformis]
MNDNVLTSYSFLAALSENETDIYKTVYLPLFKRAISSYAAKKSSKVSNSIQGTDIDIQSIILEEYGIEVPILIVRKLIKAVGTSLSKKERNIFKFDIFEDGKAFQFTNYNYFSTEEIYDRERRNAQALQQAFEDYLKSENLSEKNIPSFSQFIDKNKCNLSSFFSGKNGLIHDVEGSFMAHVNFLQHIEGGYHYLYQTAERIYLGSVIASFLETGVDLESKMDNNIIYYLDTQIVLEALDLQKAEDTLPTQELLKLIRATGGKIRLLDITINEIHKIIELAINNYSKSHPTTTVNEACVRIGKNKTWLISINGKLESFIKAELQVDIDGILETKMSLYSKSEDVNLLKQTRIHKSTAIHDVAAYLHVRDRREGNIRLFQKAKYWFVTANKKLADFNISRKTNGFVNETIMPEELTSLLFLKNPQKLAKKVSQIGLNELIAQTLSEEYASKELINEIDIAIKESADLSAEDYNILFSSIALQSTNKIQKLLEEISDKRKFNESIHKLIEKERTKRAKSKEEKLQRQKLFEEVNHEKLSLEEKLKNLEAKLSQGEKEREEQQERIRKIEEQQAESLLKRKKAQRSFWLALGGLILSIVIFLVALYYPTLFSGMKDFIKGIASLGGYGD